MDPLLDWVLRAGLASLFAVAAIHKVRDRDAFARTLRDYRLLPERLCGPLVPVLIGCEALLAGLLLAQGNRLEASLAASGVLAVYTAAIGINLARGRREIDCGCLGPGHRQPLSGWLLARNGLLLFAALLVVLPPSQRVLGSVDAISFPFGLGVLFLLFASANQLVAQATRIQALRRTS